MRFSRLGWSLKKITWGLNGRLESDLGYLRGGIGSSRWGFRRPE
jgi:hypothetical protein